MGQLVQLEIPGTERTSIQVMLKRVSEIEDDLKAVRDLAKRMNVGVSQIAIAVRKIKQELEVLNR